MIKYYMGIDPGIVAGISIIGGDGKILSVDDVPCTEVASYIDNAFALWRGKDFELVCYIEKSQAMPGQGVVSMFKYGRSFGVLLGTLIAFNIPYQEVRPQSWKKHMLKDMDKSSKLSSIKKAAQLFPERVRDFRLKPGAKSSVDEHKAEATLMAEYCRRTWGK